MNDVQIAELPCSSFQKMLPGPMDKVKSLSRVQLFVTPWTVAYEAPPSMGFSRQEYWSGLPFPSPGDLPNPEIKPRFPALQAGTLPSKPPGKNSCNSTRTKTQSDFKNGQRTLFGVLLKEYIQKASRHIKNAQYC